MKPSIIALLVSIIPWAAVTSAQEQVVIEAFESSGQIQFSKVSNAVSYRVEWATNAGGTWTNFSEGAAYLDEIISPGLGVATAYVPMVYRVVASLASLATNYLVIDISAGPNAQNYPVIYLDNVPPGGWSDEYKTTKLVLRRIPAGKFLMGSPANELGRSGDEELHQVELTKDFYIGVFEVTQKQWERVMGDWPSYFQNINYRDSRPLDGISYYRIRENPAGIDDLLVNWPSNNTVNDDSFVGKLRIKTQLSTIDLPTEAQWEYACRAGTSTALNSGFNLLDINSDIRMSVVGRYWHNSGQTYSSIAGISNGTAPVGSYSPNAWGLYDMHGNAVEWCLDWYDQYKRDEIDPKGGESGLTRVIRSGSFLLPAYVCRSAQRISAEPQQSSFQDGAAGFRLAITVQ